MSKNRGRGRGGKQGITSLITGGIMSLVMIGVVLAGLQLLGVSSMNDSIKVAKEKALEYSECIPAGECGLISILEGINFGGGDGTGINLGGSGDSGIDLGKTGDSGIDLNGEGIDLGKITLPEKEGVNLNLEGLSIDRKVKGYKGPASGEPYVNNAGLVNKDASQTMLETLVTVPDKEDDKKNVGYSRAEWKHWTGTEGRSCWNTREEILYRDAVPGTAKLVDKQKKATDKYEEACAFGTPIEEDGRIKVSTEKSGEWIGPYSGKKITDSSEIDIDHVVPLSNAARNGGQEWSAEKKETFANDPDNLLVTTAKENRTKGDKGPGKYMPPNKTYQCQYAKTYTAVVYKYDLSITESDYKELSKAIKACKH